MREKESRRILLSALKRPATSSIAVLSALSTRSFAKKKKGRERKTIYARKKRKEERESLDSFERERGKKEEELEITGARGLLSVVLDHVLPRGDDEVPVKGCGVAERGIFLDPHAAPRDLGKFLQPDLEKERKKERELKAHETIDLASIKARLGGGRTTG